MIDKEAYKFFRANAGGWVGHNAETALHLARAERWGEIHGWYSDWEPDPNGDLGDHEEWCSDARAKRNHGHDVEGCVIYDSAGNHLASLWGTIDPTSAYRRVVEAELCSEALAEIMTATRNDIESTNYLAL